MFWLWIIAITLIARWLALKSPERRDADNRLDPCTRASLFPCCYYMSKPFLTPSPQALAWLEARMKVEPPVLYAPDLQPAEDPEAPDLQTDKLLNPKQNTFLHSCSGSCQPPDTILVTTIECYCLASVSSHSSLHCPFRLGKPRASIMRSRTCSFQPAHGFDIVPFLPTLKLNVTGRSYAFLPCHLNIRSHTETEEIQSNRCLPLNEVR